VSKLCFGGDFIYAKRREGDTVRLTEILGMKTSVPDFPLTTFMMDPIGPADDPSHFCWEP
jgi:hypothetical protein